MQIRLRRPPAIGLVGVGAVSVQFGAALATRLFHRVGPVGAVTLRLVIAAVILAVAVAVGGERRRRELDGAHRQPAPAGELPRRRRGSGELPQHLLAGERRAQGSADVPVAAAFGLVLLAMNLSFYEAIDRIPLGVAVTLEFSGPLGLSLVGSRRWADGLWALLAGAGVALLASGAGRRLDPAGIGLALVAGTCWIGYILLSKQTGRRFDAPLGLGIAMVSAALVVLPAGLAAAGGRLFDPGVLLVGATVALLSSVLPYTLELMALRAVSPRAFGVMLSVDPAVAAVAGLVVVGQHLSAREVAALCLVVAGNLGNSLVGRPAGAPQDRMVT